MSKRPSGFPALVILTVSYAVGFVGTWAINSSIAFWYLVVDKPSWAAPNWLLVPVWIVLHGLFGGAAWSLWLSPTESRGRMKALFLLGLVLVLNAVWAVTLFYGHRPLSAFVVAAALWLLTGGATFWTWRASALAGRLMVPCLLWITYAAAFSGVVWRLNR